MINFHHRLCEKTFSISQVRFQLLYLRTYTIFQISSFCFFKSGLKKLNLCLNVFHFFFISFNLCYQGIHFFYLFFNFNCVVLYFLIQIINSLIDLFDLIFKIIDLVFKCFNAGLVIFFFSVGFLKSYFCFMDVPLYFFFVMSQFHKIMLKASQQFFNFILLSQRLFLLLNNSSNLNLNIIYSLVQIQQTLSQLHQLSHFPQEWKFLIEKLIKIHCLYFWSRKLFLIFGVVIFSINLAIQDRMIINLTKHMQDKTDQRLKLFKMLANDPEKTRDIWGLERGKDEKNQIDKFLQKFMESKGCIQFLNKKQKGILKSFLEAIFLGQDQDEFRKQFAKFQEKIFLLNESSSLQIIKGQDIVVNIIYHPKRIDINYKCNSYRLQEWIEKFVKVRINNEQLNVRTNTHQLRILDGKKQSKDNYTGIYLFDPFFNSLKIKIYKKYNSPFIRKFKIQPLNNINFKYDKDQTQQTWINQYDFKQSDPIKNMVNYVIQKENGPLDDKEQILDKLNNQRFNFIKDLMFNTNQILKSLPKKRWAYELQAQLEKLKGIQKNKNNKNYDDDPQKLECIRKGNSHKILRYVFYMTKNQTGEGIKILKQEIPYLNPDLVQTAISLIQKELKIQELFIKLKQYFLIFSITDKEKNQNEIKKLSTPNGILFYGPPGTGKTRLTEDLAELMGMNLVSVGLSSAQFMRQLVGQAKGVVSSYLKRSQLSPHLFCCFSIDQIDAIVGDRRSRDSNSGQAIAMFLSGLGGNQNIQNLLVFGSTNFKNKIDEAIIRRFTPDFYVGLPSQQQRKNIIQSLLPTLQKQSAIFLSEITPNFSGAAVGKICNALAVKIKNKNPSFQNSKLLEIVETVGIQFKIKLGKHTYPHLHQNINRQFTIDLLKSAYNQLIIIEKDFHNLQNKKNLFKIVFAQYEKLWNGQNILPFLEMKQIKVNLNLTNNDNPSFKQIKQWIQKSLKNNGNKINFIALDQQKQAQKYHKKQYDRPTALVINIKGEELFSRNLFLNNPKKNLYVIYYVEGITSQIIFQMSSHKICYDKKYYSGRFIVDLTNQIKPAMIFQRSQTQNCPLKLQNKYFLQKGVNMTKNALPQIVEFLMSRKVDYIQMIDSQLLHDNNAFDPLTSLNIINSKISEALNYNKSALIIDTSSLISLRKDLNNCGQNNNVGINQPAIYQSIIELIRTFAEIDGNKQEWIAIIVEDDQLLTMIKRDAKWPNSPEQQKRKIQNQASKVSKVCKNCSLLYTGQQNTKQKNCRKHYGYFIYEGDFSIDRNIRLNEVKRLQITQNLGIQDQSKKKRYRYSCCLKYIDSQACQSFHHWNGVQNDQNLIHPQKLAKHKYPEWLRTCQIMRQEVLSYLALQQLTK